MHTGKPMLDNLIISVPDVWAAQAGGLAQTEQGEIHQQYSAAGQ